MQRWQRWALRNAGSVAAVLGLLWIVGVAGEAAGAWRPRGLVLGVALAAAFAALTLALWVHWRRERAVREAAIPQFLKRKLRENYPQLSGKDCDLVERGLRQFFYACLRSRRRFVAMPSKAVDTLWHEFILHTRGYRAWCDLTLGRFLDHTPAEALGPRVSSNDGLRRAWYWACRDEAIDPRRPSRLPLLFALDAKLALADGYVYQADCVSRGPFIAGSETRAGGSYCGADFANSSFGGDAGSFGGSESSGGDGGSGGSDGGGGDGGGCGGGGGD